MSRCDGCARRFTGAGPRRHGDSCPKLDDPDGFEKRQAILHEMMAELRREFGVGPDGRIPVEKWRELEELYAAAPPPKEPNE